MNVVLVSYSYPPSEGPAGERIYFFAKKLSDKKINVVILSANSGGERHYPDLDNVKHIQVGELVDLRYKSGFSLAKKVISFFKLKFHILKSFKFLFDLTPHGRWKNEVLNKIKSGHIRLPNQVDFVISSFPDRSSVDVGKVIANQYKAKWIIDYRDLWALNHYSDHSSITKLYLGWKEKLIIKNSCALIFASDGLMSDFKTYFNLPTKMLSIYNGYNPLDQKRKEPRNLDAPFSIVYTGSLYGGKRDISPFFKLLDEIPDSVFKICLLSKYADSDYIESIIPDHLSNRILIRYEVPHNETIELQKSADILALVVTNDGIDFSYPTAKIFEYMKAGVEIVSNARPGSEIDKILLETKSGCLIDNYIAKGQNPEFNKRNILKYSREVQNEKLYNLLISLK
ncbi:hypothetical protein N9I24_04810 [Gammaproteobacteria bacterium]|nr:hypothetical protein [Gammaproteobacteria bacterium]